MIVEAVKEAVQRRKRREGRLTKTEIASCCVVQFKIRVDTGVDTGTSSLVKAVQVDPVG